jgi:imipenem/basic amino acid-specific outer membrane pore
MKATRSLMALAIALAGTSLAQAEGNDSATGFIDGSKLNILNRNMYVNSDIRNNHDVMDDPDTDEDESSNAQNYQEEWAHGVWVEYESGFTEGPVGFGVDVQAYVGFKLDTGDGTNGWGLMPVDGNGDAKDQYGEMGGAAKMKFSNTVVKWGEMKTDNPVLDTGDPGLLPETTEGVQIISQEVEDLTFEAGHYTAFNNAASTNDDDELAPGYGTGKAGDTVDLAGVVYEISEKTNASFYSAHFDDTWNQHYANFNHTLPLSETQSVNFDVNIYRTVDTGENYQGEINNTSYSAAVAYTAGAHTLTAGYQTIHGNTPFDYIGDDTIRLNNSMELSDFNAPNEKSFRLGYDLDMGEAFGCNGMSFSANYGRGDNIDGSKADKNGGYADMYGDGGSHWERDFALTYAVQEGAAKDLTVTFLQSTHRAAGEFGEEDRDEIQLIVEYPLDLL